MNDHEGLNNTVKCAADSAKAVSRFEPCVSPVVEHVCPPRSSDRVECSLGKLLSLGEKGVTQEEGVLRTWPLEVSGAIRRGAPWMEIHPFPLVFEGPENRGTLLRSNVQISNLSSGVLNVTAAASQPSQLLLQHSTFTLAPGETKSLPVVLRSRTRRGPFKTDAQRDCRDNALSSGAPVFQQRLTFHSACGAVDLPVFFKHSLVESKSKGRRLQPSRVEASLKRESFSPPREPLTGKPSPRGTDDEAAEAAKRETSTATAFSAPAPLERPLNSKVSAFAASPQEQHAGSGVAAEGCCAAPPDEVSEGSGSASSLALRNAFSPLAAAAKAPDEEATFPSLVSNSSFVCVSSKSSSSPSPSAPLSPASTMLSAVPTGTLSAGTLSLVSQRASLSAAEAKAAAVSAANAAAAAAVSASFHEGDEAEASDASDARQPCPSLALNALLLDSAARSGEAFPEKARSLCCCEGKDGDSLLLLDERLLGGPSVKDAVAASAAPEASAPPPELLARTRDGELLDSEEMQNAQRLLLRALRRSEKRAATKAEAARKRAAAAAAEARAREDALEKQLAAAKLQQQRLHCCLVQLQREGEERLLEQSRLHEQLTAELEAQLEAAQRSAAAAAARSGFADAESQTPPFPEDWQPFAALKKLLARGDEERRAEALPTETEKQLGEELRRGAAALEAAEERASTAEAELRAAGEAATEEAALHAETLNALRQRLEAVEAELRGAEESLLSERRKVAVRDQALAELRHSQASALRKAAARVAELEALLEKRKAVEGALRRSLRESLRSLHVLNRSSRRETSPLASVVQTPPDHPQQQPPLPPRQVLALPADIQELIDRLSDEEDAEPPRPWPSPRTQPGRPLAGRVSSEAEEDATSPSGSSRAESLGSFAEAFAQSPRASFTAETPLQPDGDALDEFSENPRRSRLLEQLRIPRPASRREVGGRDAFRRRALLQTQGLRQRVEELTAALVAKQLLVGAAEGVVNQQRLHLKAALEARACAESLEAEAAAAVVSLVATNASLRAKLAAAESQASEATRVGRKAVQAAEAAALAEARAKARCASLQREQKQLRVLQRRETQRLVSEGAASTQRQVQALVEAAVFAARETPATNVSSTNVSSTNVSNGGEAAAFEAQEGLLLTLLREVAAALSALREDVLVLRAEDPQPSWQTLCEAAVAALRFGGKQLASCPGPSRAPREALPALTSPRSVENGFVVGCVWPAAPKEKGLSPIADASAAAGDAQAEEASEAASSLRLHVSVCLHRVLEGLGELLLALGRRVVSAESKAESFEAATRVWGELWRSQRIQAFDNAREATALRREMHALAKQVSEHGASLDSLVARDLQVHRRAAEFASAAASEAFFELHSKEQQLNALLPFLRRTQQRLARLQQTRALQEQSHRLAVEQLHTEIERDILQRISKWRHSVLEEAAAEAAAAVRRPGGALFDDFNFDFAGFSAFDGQSTETKAKEGCEKERLEFSVEDSASRAAAASLALLEFSHKHKRLLALVEAKEGLLQEALAQLQQIQRQKQQTSGFSLWHGHDPEAPPPAVGDEVAAEDSREGVFLNSAEKECGGGKTSEVNAEAAAVGPFGLCCLRMSSLLREKATLSRQLDEERLQGLQQSRLLAAASSEASSLRLQIAALREAAFAAEAAQTEALVVRQELSLWREKTNSAENLAAQQREQHKAEVRNLQTAHEVRLQQSERECRSRLEREFGEALAKAQAEAAEGREAERRRLQLERQLQESRQQVQALARAGEEHVAQSELLLSAVQTVRTAQTAMNNDEETERSRPLSELRPLVMTLVDLSTRLVSGERERLFAAVGGNELCNKGTMSNHSSTSAVQHKTGTLSANAECLLRGYRLLLLALAERLFQKQPAPDSPSSSPAEASAFWQSLKGAFENTRCAKCAAGAFASGLVRLPFEKKKALRVAERKGSLLLKILRSQAQTLAVVSLAQERVLALCQERSRTLAGVESLEERALSCLLRHSASDTRAALREALSCGAALLAALAQASASPEMAAAAESLRSRLSSPRPEFAPLARRSAAQQQPLSPPKGQTRASRAEQQRPLRRRGGLGNKVSSSQSAAVSQIASEEKTGLRPTAAFLERQSPCLLDLPQPPSREGAALSEAGFLFCGEEELAPESQRQVSSSRAEGSAPTETLCKDSLVESSVGRGAAPAAQPPLHSSRRREIFLLEPSACDLHGQGARLSASSQSTRLLPERPAFEGGDELPLGRSSSQRPLSPFPEERRLRVVVAKEASRAGTEDDALGGGVSRAETGRQLGISCRCALPADCGGGFLHRATTLSAESEAAAPSSCASVFLGGVDLSGGTWRQRELGANGTAASPLHSVCAFSEGQASWRPPLISEGPSAAFNFFK